MVMFAFFADRIRRPVLILPFHECFDIRPHPANIE
jgi:hypothetical protein